MKPALALTSVALVAGAMCACGSATNTNHTATPSPTTTVTPSAIAPATPAPATTPAPNSGQCTAATVQVRLNNEQGAAGSIYAEFEARSSDGACAVDGYPGVVMLDGAGNAMPTTAQPQSGTTPQPVTLAAGTSPLGATATAGHGWFILSWNDNQCASSQASTPQSWRITLPGGQGSVVVSARDQSGALPMVCSAAVTVGPFRANK